MGDLHLCYYFCKNGRLFADFLARVIEPGFIFAETFTGAILPDPNFAKSLTHVE